jgi:predicted tellurium resistance membrane protein TerC
VDLSFLSSPETWIALLTLTALEIVLGIDNIVFISIMAGKLPPAQRGQAYALGLGAAMVMRILLLFSISFIVGLTAPLFTLPFIDREVSGRDLILFGGGLFLIAKATFEIHERLEGSESGASTTRAGATLRSVVLQLMLLDIIFSLDSVITAVGMARELAVMVAAVVIAVLVMMLAAEPISAFVDEHPTVKILALSFLLLIGLSLVADGFGQHIPKGYIYFAMGFSVMVEMINIRVRRKALPVHLRQRYSDETEGQ